MQRTETPEGIQQMRSRPIVLFLSLVLSGCAAIEERKDLEDRQWYWGVGLDAEQDTSLKGAMYSLRASQIAVGGWSELYTWDGHRYFQGFLNVFAGHRWNKYLDLEVSVHGIGAKSTCESRALVVDPREPTREPHLTDPHLVEQTGVFKEEPFRAKGAFHPVLGVGLEYDGTFRLGVHRAQGSYFINRPTVHGGRAI